MTLLLGTFLFLKVVIEDFVYGLAGFLSLDLSERVVREKTGSGLVVISMLLHLGASSGSYPRNQTLRRKQKIPPYVEYGKPLITGFCTILVLASILQKFNQCCTLVQEWYSWWLSVLVYLSSSL